MCFIKSIKQDAFTERRAMKEEFPRFFVRPREFFYRQNSIVIPINTEKEKGFSK